MASFLTVSSVRAEASKIVWAQFLFVNVSVRTNRSQWAEASFVVRAGRALELWIDVLIWAVVTRLTCPPLLPVIAFWHLPEVVFVQKFAGLAFLA